MPGLPLTGVPTASSIGVRGVPATDRPAPSAAPAPSAPEGEPISAPGTSREGMDGRCSWLVSCVNSCNNTSSGTCRDPKPPVLEVDSRGCGGSQGCRGELGSLLCRASQDASRREARLTWGRRWEGEIGGRPTDAGAEVAVARGAPSSPLAPSCAPATGDSAGCAVLAMGPEGELSGDTDRAPEGSDPGSGESPAVARGLRGCTPEASGGSLTSGVAKCQSSCTSRSASRTRAPVSPSAPARRALFPVAGETSWSLASASPASASGETTSSPPSVPSTGASLPRLLRLGGVGEPAGALPPAPDLPPGPRPAAGEGPRDDAARGVAARLCEAEASDPVSLGARMRGRLRVKQRRVVA